MPIRACALVFWAKNSVFRLRKGRERRRQAIVGGSILCQSAVCTRLRLRYAAAMECSVQRVNSPLARGVPEGRGVVTAIKQKKPPKRAVIIMIIGNYGSTVCSCGSVEAAHVYISSPSSQEV